MGHSKMKSSLKKIAIVTLVWILMAVFLALYELFFLWGNGLDVTMSVQHYILSYVGAAFFAGIFGGGFVVLKFEKSLRKYPYGRALVNLMFWFTLIYFFAHVVGSILGNTLFFEFSLFDPKIQSSIISYFTSFNFLQGYLFWGIVNLLTIIALEVNKKYGPGVFRDFLLGRYFHPRKEERIFMFLDLKGSTTIAEKIGEESFFNFIKDFYADATPAILEFKGEIYQYVGDEILVSWEMEKGLRDARFLNCFFEIKNSFENRSEYYQNKYGVIPKFKAGFHGGTVMAGEVGEVKKDIAFSGDVLNTSARIQGECNRLGVDILMSDYLLTKMENIPLSYIFKTVEKIKLRGKSEEVGLVTVNKKYD